MKRGTYHGKQEREKKNVALNDDQFDNVSGGFGPVNSCLDNSVCKNYDNCDSCQRFLCPHNPCNPKIDPKDLFLEF